MNFQFAWKIVELPSRGQKANHGEGSGADKQSDEAVEPSVEMECELWNRIHSEIVLGF